MRQLGKSFQQIISLTFRIMGIALLFYLPVFSSCTLFEGIKPVGNPPTLLWKITLPIGGISFDAADIQFNDGILFNRLEDNSHYLYFIHKETGAIFWKWNDALPNDNLRFRWFYRYNNLAVASTGTGLYCINLQTGLTKWKKAVTWEYVDRVTGSGYWFYTSVSTYNNVDSVNIVTVIRGNLQDGQLNELITEKNQRYDGYSVDPVSIGQDEGLLILSQQKIQTGKFKTSFSLYNATKNMWEYQAKLVDTKTYRSSAPHFNVSKTKALLYSDSTIYSVYTHTAEVAWTRKLNSGISLTKRLANGNIIVTPWYNPTHCFDSDTGNELWQQKTSVTSSSVELNGVLYQFESLPWSKKYLSAVDASSGNIWWRFENSDGFGLSVATGVNGGNGRVIVANAKTASCYEAAR